GAWWLLGSSGKGAGKSWEWWSGVESGGGGAVKVGGKIGCSCYSSCSNRGREKYL
nr:hypothetical protein [Tanacetum cinerariifolium]